MNHEFGNIICCIIIALLMWWMMARKVNPIIKELDASRNELCNLTCEVSRQARRNRKQ